MGGGGGGGVRREVTFFVTVHKIWTMLRVTSSSKKMHLPRKYSCMEYGSTLGKQKPQWNLVT